MKTSTLICLIFIASVVCIVVLIGCVSIGMYTAYFLEWRDSISCEEVTGFNWNSPLVIPDEIKENVTRCYTFTIGGPSKGIKLFENGNYIGNDYFEDYSWNIFSYPKKIIKK